MIELAVLLLVTTILIQLLTLSILLNEKSPYIPPPPPKYSLTSKPKPDKIDKSKVITFTKRDKK